MAFRIHDSVVRGEIDNRAKGIVSGRIWLEGRSEPLALALRGNAHPDIAGCLLSFTNPLPRVAHTQLDALNPRQDGVAGDLTASRKARVFDISLGPTAEKLSRKEEPPAHVANSLYLEWFSQSNGRVVIETTAYEVTISAPEWRLTPPEEEQRARDVARALQEFLQSLSDAITQHQRGQKDPETPWDEHDYEKFLRESDARTDKYAELLDKYGGSKEAEAKIAREMGWERELTEEEAEEEQRRIDELNRACEEALLEPPPEPEPHREGIDWIRTSNGDLRHPLQHRCFESGIRLGRQIEALGHERPEDPHLDQFLFELHTTSAKLAGALGSFARGQGSSDASFTIACLKRALDHLHRSQAGLEAVAPKKLLPPAIVAEARRELFEIREGILNLMDEFRGQQ